MPELRIHDLRHSFASFLINNGRSLYEVQKILGHSSAKMTERYAHLAHDTLLAASNAATLALGPCINATGVHASSEEMDGKLQALNAS